MKTRNTSYRMALRVLVVIITGLLTTQLLVAQGWYNNNWSYRRSVSVPTTGALVTDLQVKITLNSSFDFTKAKSDGSDIRVTSDNGTSLIPFWIESWDAVLQQATLWVKVPTIPASGTTNVILYYGNNAATSVSSGKSTFSFFDDFESWSSTGSTGWTDVASTPSPAKADNTAAVYNGKLYVFGGYGTSGSDLLDEVFEYDPGTNAWTTKTPMPTARWGMVAVEFNGLIYVFAGQGTANNKNEVYNPANDTWDVSKAVVPANLAQQGLMAVKYGDKIHLFYKSNHYEYDPVSDSYIQKANVPEPLTWGTCATVGSKIYIIGGFSYSQSPNEASNDTYEYDPVANTWTTKMSMPVSLYGVTRENPVINGKIYVTHGHAGSPFFVTNYAYDPSTDTWEQKGSAAHARDGVGCGVIDNKLYVVGGRDVPSAPYGVAWAEVYDPVADTWMPPSGPELWTTSGTSYVYADGSAKYKGNYGMKISQSSGTGLLYAQSVNGFGNVYALDFNWNVTSLGSGSGTWPETEIRLTEDPASVNGHLYNYNQTNNQQMLRWLTGSTWTNLQYCSRNTWYKTTVVRNGTSSRVIFDGTTYQPLTTPSGGTGKFRFGQFFATTQYIDNVRVRQWAGSDPTTTVSTEQELFIWDGSESTAWGTTGNWPNNAVPDPGDYVIIPGGAPNNPGIDGNLTVGAGGSLIMQAGSTLTVTGTLSTSDNLFIESSGLALNGSLIVNGTTSGKVTYNRQLPSANYHYLSSPVSSATLTTGLTPWNEVTGSWGSPTTSPSSGIGYALQTSGVTSLSFAGPLVTSDLIIDVSSPYGAYWTGSGAYNDRTPASGRDFTTNWGGGGFNLLGNPYTSALNVNNGTNSFLTVNDTQFDPNYKAIYLYNGSSYDFIGSQIGGWGIAPTQLPQTQVQAGQGFFVLANYDGSAFTFKRDMQEHAPGVSLLKSTKTGDSWPGLYLKALYGGKESSTLIVYNEDMTAGLDPGFDVGQLSVNPDVEIYTSLVLKDNSVNFARQALPTADADKNIVPVGIDSEKGGEVTFSAYTVPLGTNKFWLEDRTNGTFTDLNSNTYTVTLPAKTYGTGRFFIIASTNTPTGINQPQTEDTGVRVWTSNEKVIIKGEVSDRAICEIYDLRGKKILATKLVDSELNTVTLPSGMHGVYLVRVVDGVKVTTRKVALL